MDGKRCPLKVVTNDEREQRRQQNLKEAREYNRRGDRRKAEEKYKMCIKIRDDFTKAVMKEVVRNFHKDNRVQLVWSPYEADSQLAKLCVDQTAHAVVTEVRRWWPLWSSSYSNPTILTFSSYPVVYRIRIFLFTLQLHIVLSPCFINWIEELVPVM
jgi:hypothetical protein